MNLNLRSKWAVLMLCLLVFAGFAVAQTSKGTVSGVITDQSGAVVSNAKVTLVQVETNLTRETVSNNAGIYRYDAVNLGTYTIKVAAQGFAASATKTFTVLANQNASVDVAMKVGSSEQVVNVEAAAATVALQTDEQLRGGNIEAQKLATLPISGQNSLNLMTLLPGIVPTNMSGGGSLDSGVGSVNGSRPRANNFMVDGVENNDVSVAGPAITLTNNDAIQEVSVQAANFSAEFGRSGGAVVNQITKSGTNNLHGTVAWVYRSDVLNAESFDEKMGGKGKSPFLEHIPAFTVGGPVFIPKVYDGHNKSFFFVAGQWDRYNEGSQQRQVVVPTAAGIATLKALAPNCKNAQLYLNSIGDMVAPTKSGSIDLSIPQSVFNVTGSCDGTTRAGSRLEYGTATRVAPVLFKGNTQQARFDHYFTDTHQVAVRFMSSPGGYPGIYSIGMAPAFDAGYQSKSYTGAITDTLVINTHLTNEIRLNYFRVGVDWPVLASNGIGTTLPAIGITNFTTLGTNSSYPQGRTFNNYELQETMTWMTGRHTIRFGFDINKQIARQIAPIGPRGTLSYKDSSSTLGAVTAFANFLDDFSGAGNAVVSKPFGTAVYHPNTFRQSYFVQDAWKVNPSLTINAGLRYDYFGQPANGNFPYPAASMDPANFPNKAEIPADKNNFAPSVGFAYNPKWGFFADGKTVIRGGFQIGYDGWYNNLLSNMAAAAPNNPSNLSYNATINATTPRGVAGTYNTIFPTLVPAPYTNPLVDTSNQFAANIRNPYTMRYSFGVQRELPSRMVLDVSYVGSQSRKLFITRDLNPRTPNPDGTAGPRINPAMGMRGVRDSAGTSNYNSLQIGLRSKTLKTFAGDVGFDSSYTYAKNMDNASETFATSSAGSAYNSSRWLALQDPRLDYSVSDLDRRHRWVTSLMWDIRAPKNGFLSEGVFAQVLGGWSITASVPVMSGTPFTVLNGIDRDGDGSPAADRPDIGNPNAPYTSRAIISTAAQGCGSGLWNPDAGACTTADQVRWVQSKALPGAKTARRNSVFTPGSIYADVNILKKFRIREGLNMEARAEIFNITNTWNFNYPANGLALNGLSLNAGANRFLPARTESDYYTNPGRRTIRLGMKVIF